MAMELSRFGDATADGTVELEGFGAGVAAEGRLITCSS